MSHSSARASHSSAFTVDVRHQAGCISHWRGSPFADRPASSVPDKKEEVAISSMQLPLFPPCTGSFAFRSAVSVSAAKICTATHAHAAHAHGHQHGHRGAVHLHHAFSLPQEIIQSITCPIDFVNPVGCTDDVFYIRFAHFPHPVACKIFLRRCNPLQNAAGNATIICDTHILRGTCL